MIAPWTESLRYWKLARSITLVPLASRGLSYSSQHGSATLLQSYWNPTSVARCKRQAGDHLANLAAGNFRVVEGSA